MYPTDTAMADQYQGRVNVWRVVRWAVTAAASLVLTVLFMTTATQAAPAPNDDVAYHTMATCNAGDYSCYVAQCQNGNYNYCGYNLGGIGSVYYVGNFPYGPQNFSTYNPDFYNNVYVRPYYTGYIWPYNGSYVWPRYYNNIFGTPYVNGRYYGNFCPSGNFTACYNNINNCPSGNFTCLRNNGYWPYYRWWEADGTGTATYQVQEGTQPAPAPAAQPVAAPVAPPQAAPAPAPAQVTAPAQVAAPAPAAPTAQVATGLNASTQTSAPAPAVDAGGAGVKILSVQSAGPKVTATTEHDDSR